MIQERIDYLSSPEELRFHAESPESDGRNHVLPDVLYACADKIDQLEKEIERLQSLNKRLVEDGERLLKNHIAEPYPNDYVCHLCYHSARGDENKIEHKSDCPITLHHQLMEKLEGREG